VNLISEYIKYRWKAKGRHGIHSPFAYDFVDKCLRISLDESFVQKRKLISKSLKKNEQSIIIQDFGAGSKKMNSERTVRKIFTYSSSKGKYADLLYRICRFYKPQHVLELGTSLGYGALHLASGNPVGKVTTVEGCPETYRIAKSVLKAFDNTNISSINSPFDHFLTQLTNETFDVIYIDGHHDGNALLRYSKKLLAHSHDETIFIIDDIRWSNGMLAAWKSLVHHAEFHLTMDMWRMGILIKRSHQAKEHFVIRY
jgi:predicted O-methyltransferase YrrM